MKKITIATHDGNFHTDDVCAVATLIIALSDKNDIEIIRTRDEKILEKSDYVIDVGREYNPKKKRFDHHQNNLINRKNNIPYASFGLIWKEYGLGLCKNSKKVWQRIDEKLVQYIDAADNGVDVLNNKESDLTCYSIIDIFTSLNPSWKEDANYDEMFKGAVLLAEVVLRRIITKTIHEIESEKEVIKRYKLSKDKRIIVLNKKYPWSNILNKFKEPLYVIYPTRDNESWYISAVRDNPKSFKNRKDLPLKWAGKEGEDLQKVTGVKDSIFCHKKRFMAVTKTKEGAINLARLAI